MKISNDKSLFLSRVCVFAFAVILAALVAGAPWIWPFVLHRAGVVRLYITVTYVSAVPAGVVLYCLHRLLASAAAADVFTDANVARLRAVSWCLAAAAAVYAAGGFFDWYLFVLAVAAAFAALIVRVLKNVLAEAVELKRENDFTI